MSEVKQIRKSIIQSRGELLRALMYVRFNITSPSEISLIQELIELNKDYPVPITKDIRSQMSEFTKIPINTISMVIGRLEKAQVLKKQGKAVILNPVFNNWNLTTEILLKTQAQ
jgi:hypothetical protein